MLSQETVLFRRCDIRMDLSDEGAESRHGSSTREFLAGFVPMTAGTPLRHARL